MPEQHGPRLVTPEPYYSCSGCTHLIHVPNPGPGIAMVPACNVTRVTTLPLSYFTPSWCPLMPVEKEESDERKPDA